MFAIAFDLALGATAANHPVGVRQAYRDVESTLGRYGFQRVQQSVFMVESDDLANLTSAMTALRSLPWFPECVTDIRAFRVEQWSDFTTFVKRGDNR